MKINQIILSEMATTAGSVATVAKPMGEAQKRPKVAGLEPAEKVMFGKAKKKGPYANSLSEGKVKQLAMDLKGGKDGLSDEEFKKKYGKTKAEVRKEMQNKPQKAEPVSEAKLDEEDIIVIPGQGMKRKTGFVPHGQSRVDHEVEMARSDVLATMKNAKAIYQLLKDRSEDEGLEGWVQEKLIKANDYLNAVKEYYDEKMMKEMTAGTIAGGIAAEGVAEEISRRGFLKGLAGVAGGLGVVGVANQLGQTRNLDSENVTTVNGERYTLGRPSLGAKLDGKTSAGKYKLVKDDKGNMVYIWNDVRTVGGPTRFVKKFIPVDQVNEQGVAEGAKVDRMVKHIAKSEKKLGHSKKEAENIAWATANKRGYLDNKNKKAK